MNPQDGPGATVVRPGPLCTVQDLGRWVGRRQGISPGGAMDRRACLWANRLLGNDPEAALLEITLGGATFAFSRATTVALTGAECEVRLDDVPVPNWRTLRVDVGQTLRFAHSRSGVRAYLAFPGGLIATRRFGSASVVLREGLQDGSQAVVAPGAELHWYGASSDETELPMRGVPPSLISQPTEALELPLIVGYEWHQFSEGDRTKVWGEEWAVEVASDRVAVRLGGAVLMSGPTSLDSTPLVDGTVQVPGSGLPLIFMRDRPTVGGYPKLGSIDPGALDHLAQAQPGTRVRFVPADSETVLEELRERRAFFGLSLPSAEDSS